MNRHVGASGDRYRRHHLPISAIGSDIKAASAVIYHNKSFKFVMRQEKARTIRRSKRKNRDEQVSM